MDRKFHSRSKFSSSIEISNFFDLWALWVIGGPGILQVKNMHYIFEIFRPLQSGHSRRLWLSENSLLEKFSGKFRRCWKLGNVSETATPTTCLKSTAVHLQFVRQYTPHLYRRTFLASKLRRKGNPAIRL